MAKSFRWLREKLNQRRIKEKVIRADEIALIREQPGIAINKIREQAICCIGCQKLLGFVASQVIAPPNKSFAFRTRFACEECGPKTATLSLMEVKGNEH